jgi:hypothetical protein
MCPTFVYANDYSAENPKGNPSTAKDVYCYDVASTGATLPDFLRKLVLVIILANASGYAP